MFKHPTRILLIAIAALATEIFCPARPFAQTPAANEELTLPSELANNLKKITAESTKQCFADYDEQIATIMKNVQNAPAARLNDPGFARNVNANLESVRGEIADGIKCYRWVSYQDPQNWPAAGCVIARRNSIETKYGPVDMSTEMRYDLSAKLDHLDAYFDNSLQISLGENGKDILNSNFRNPDGSMNRYHARYAPYVLINSPTEANLEALRAQMEKLPSLCIAQM